MPRITSAPKEEEIRSRASLLSSREPGRDDILRARGLDPAKQNSISGNEETALKSAFNVASQSGDIGAADSQAKIFAAAITAGAKGKDRGSAFATARDVQDAANIRDNMLAQFTSQLLTNPLPSLASNLRGEGAKGGRNIFQNYMAELSTSGIRDPRKKLQLLNEFKADVNKRVEEVKGNFFNKQQTQMFLLQAAQQKVKDTNASFESGLANEQDLKKAKMEMEKHEMNMKLATAELAKINKALAGTGKGGTGAYNKELSFQFGYLVDSKGNPILDEAGERIPFTEEPETKNEPTSEFGITTKVKSKVGKLLQANKALPEDKKLNQSEVMSAIEQEGFDPTSDEFSSLIDQFPKTPGGLFFFGKRKGPG